MKLSRSVRYAFIALVHLTQADPQTYIMAKQIAQDHDIPPEYLLKILHQLTRTGLLKSVRGPQGGFALNLRPDEISCFDIIETVEGPLFDTGTLSEQSGLNSVEKRLAHLYRQAGEQTANLFKKTTLMHLTQPKSDKVFSR